MNVKVPKFLMEMLEKQYGKELATQIQEGYQEKRKTTFRINTLKSTKEEIKHILEENEIQYQNVKWSDEAFILTNVTEKEIKKLAIYEEGKIYLQSLSSMLPPIIMEPQEGTDILDMAAAPGGKTTQIASITNNKANITACEKNKIRAQRLQYNLEKQGAKVYVITEDATQIDDFFSFDQILLDAPCSGSGTIAMNIDENRKRQKTRKEEIITKEHIQKFSKTQMKLLQKAIHLLKPGKEIIYATCSILASENEENIQKILAEKKVEIVPITCIHQKTMDELAIPLLPTKIRRNPLCCTKRTL